GLPPLSGFIAKFAMLTKLFADPDNIRWENWLFAALIMLSGLAAWLALSGAGIRIFWAPIDATVPRVSTIEIIPIVLLLSLTLALTVGGGPVMQYMEKTAQSAYAPAPYIESVLPSRPDGSRVEETSP